MTLHVIYHLKFPKNVISICQTINLKILINLKIVNSIRK